MSTRQELDKAGVVFVPNLMGGKKYLVTGASSGIGRDFAGRVAALGGSVLCLGRDEARVEETLQGLEGDGHRGCTSDILSIDSFKADLLRLADEQGPFDGIFHAAGMELMDSIRRIDNKKFERVFAASFYGAAAICSASMKTKVMGAGGAIVIMSSVAGSCGQLGLSLYGASKAAIDNLVKASAIEFAKKRITINSIVAGAVETEMQIRAASRLNDHSLEEYRNKHLLGFGKAGHVSNSAIYLMSPAGAWTTGSAMVVDGGFLAQ